MLARRWIASRRATPRFLQIGETYVFRPDQQIPRSGREYRPLQIKTEGNDRHPSRTPEATNATTATKATKVTKATKAIKGKRK